MVLCSGGVYVTVDILAGEVATVIVGIEVEELLEIGSAGTIESFDF
jgi:hypothetical protein